MDEKNKEIDLLHSSEVVEPARAYKSPVARVINLGPECLICTSRDGDITASGDGFGNFEDDYSSVY